jgi:hypothetical protein
LGKRGGEWLLFAMVIKINPRRFYILKCQEEKFISSSMLIRRVRFIGITGVNVSKKCDAE